MKDNHNNNYFFRDCKTLIELSYSNNYENEKINEENNNKEDNIIEINSNEQNSIFELNTIENESNFYDDISLFENDIGFVPSYNESENFYQDDNNDFSNYSNINKNICILQIVYFLTYIFIKI